MTKKIMITKKNVSRRFSDFASSDETPVDGKSGEKSKVAEKWDKAAFKKKRKKRKMTRKLSEAKLFYSRWQRFQHEPSALLRLLLLSFSRRPSVSVFDSHLTPGVREAFWGIKKKDRNIESERSSPVSSRCGTRVAADRHRREKVESYYY